MEAHLKKNFSPAQFAKTNHPDYDRFARRVEELRQALRQRDPAQLAANTGATLSQLPGDQSEFHLPLWGQPMRLTFPALTAHAGQNQAALPSFQLAMLLYYFATAQRAPDGSALENQWISFADLPDGRFYNQAFQGYTGQELARGFENDLPAFEQAATQLNGVRQPIGDAAFSFSALPRVPILAVYWLGDEDFPASGQLLFDASASRYLPTDACAILGSMLTSRLLKARPAAR